MECLLPSDSDDFREASGADTDDDDGLALAGFGGVFLGGAPSVKPSELFDYVAVGGTLDGLRFGYTQEALDVGRFVSQHLERTAARRSDVR